MRVLLAAKGLASKREPAYLQPREKVAIVGVVGVGDFIEGSRQPVQVGLLHGHVEGKCAAASSSRRQEAGEKYNSKIL